MQKKKINLFFFICSLLLATGCDYFTLDKKKEQENAIATFENEVLLYSDIKDLVPSNLTKEDSVLVVKRLIDSWALKQAMLKKAQLNVSQDTDQEINKLVREYRQSLLINRYKEQLVQQELDTVVTENEVDEYYNSNIKNFRLNEAILQIRYLVIDKDFLAQKEIKSLLKSGSIEDLEELETKQLSFKKNMLNDSLWIPVKRMLEELPFSKQELLKKSELIQKEDTINLFLAVVKNYLPKQEIAPKEYVEDKIKLILVHKRKIEVIREIEKILLRDAVKENQLIYN